MAKTKCYRPRLLHKAREAAQQAAENAAQAQGPEVPLAARSETADPKRPLIMTMDEILRAGLTLTKAQRVLVGTRLRIVLCYLKQRDLDASAQAFASLLRELRASMDDETSGEATGDAAPIHADGLLALNIANTLERHGVTTIGALRAALATRDGRRRLMAIPNFGPVRLAALFEALHSWDDREKLRAAARLSGQQAGPSSAIPSQLGTSAESAD